MSEVLASLGNIQAGIKSRRFASTLVHANSLARTIITWILVWVCVSDSALSAVVCRLRLCVSVVSLGVFNFRGGLIGCVQRCWVLGVGW